MKSTVLFILLFFGVTLSVFGQAGVLDNTFGTGGIVTSAIGNGFSTGRATALQADGKIVVAGIFSYNNVKFEFALVRYNADGTVDTTFGNHGVDTVQVDSLDDFAVSVAIQPNGKIVVAGSAFDSLQNRFAMVRFNQNGSIDTAFGVKGKVITAFGNTSDNGNALAIQADGKIIMAGSATNDSTTEFALARFDSSGVIDTTFGDSGEVTNSFGTSDDEAFSIAIQTNGEILAGGITYNGNDYDFALSCYFTNGLLDTTFGKKGKVRTDIDGYDDLARSIALQSNGKIVLAGSSLNGVTSAYEIAVVRYNVNGVLDNTFANGGIDTTTIGGFDDEGESVAVQTDGKIVVAGYADIENDDEFAVVRYNTDGSLDTTSNGGNGKVTTQIDSISNGESVLLQPDGKIVVAGYSQSLTSAYYNVAVVRYLTTLMLGIADLAGSNNSVFIYPNPIKDETILDYTLANDEILSISIYDLNGRLVLPITTNQNLSKGEYRQTLNLQSLAPGMYLLAVTDSHSKSVYIKIIKQ